jgi:transcription antitermination factor NusG
MKQRIVRWYAARVKYRTEKDIKHYLETAGIEHYIPLQDGKPSLPSLIFIRTDYERALSLPLECGFSISYLHDASSKGLQVIPDEQMRQFLFLQNFSERTLFLPNPENLQGGERVKVTGGEFAGVEGELYRIKGHKRVVVKLGNSLAVATSYIAKEHLERV